MVNYHKRIYQKIISYYRENILRARNFHMKWLSIYPRFDMKILI